MNHTTLFTTLDSYSITHALLPEEATIILGLSGGPDSLFLLHYLSTYHVAGKIKLIAAHLDHAWRPESASEVVFCNQAAQTLGIPFVHKRLPELPCTFTWRGSKEEIGRKARRFFLESVAHEHQAQCIALAHHAQDQQETFFIRLLRGSTLTGLTGMRPKHGIYIRPLLATQKTDILAYLHEHDITYLTDPSNESALFLRNRIRAQVIPALRSCDARFDASFATTMSRLHKTETFLDALAQKTFTQVSAQHNGVIQINLPELRATHPELQYRIILVWLIAAAVPFEPTQAFLDELLRFLLSPRGGTHHIHTQWHVVKQGKTAYILHSNNP